MRKSLKEQLSEKLNIPIARSKGIMTKKKMTVPITEQSFAIGKVLEMDLDATDGIALKDDYDKRRKYFVVLAEIKEDSIVGAFLINSEINKNYLIDLIGSNWLDIVLNLSNDKETLSNYLEHHFV